MSGMHGQLQMAKKLQASRIFRFAHILKIISALAPMISSKLRITFLLLGSVLSIGCNSSDTGFSISGNVSYEGEAVTNGSIGFIPITKSVGHSAGADIIDGKYEIDPSKGPIEGSYKVIIYAEKPSGKKIQADEGSSEMIDEMVQYIPAIYNSRTSLEIKLEGDQPDLDFLLKAPK